MKLFVAAKAVILHEGKVLISREAKYDEGTNEGLWDVPGGRIEAEEGLGDGLRREVMEESGLGVEIGKVLDVAETFFSINGEMCHIVRIYYQCTAKTTEVTLSKDHGRYEWLDLGQPLDKKEFVGDIGKLLIQVQKAL